METINSLINGANVSYDNLMKNAKGEYNLGEVVLKKDGFEKVNNHAGFFSYRNNVVTTEEQNRATNAAVFKALATHAIGDDREGQGKLVQLLNMEIDDTDTFERLMQGENGLNRFPYIKEAFEFLVTGNSSTPLSRDELKLLDHLLKQKREEVNPDNNKMRAYNGGENADVGKKNKEEPKKADYTTLKNLRAMKAGVMKIDLANKENENKAESWISGLHVKNISGSTLQRVTGETVNKRAAAEQIAYSQTEKSKESYAKLFLHKCMPDLLNTVNENVRNAKKLSRDDLETWKIDRFLTRLTAGVDHKFNLTWSAFNTAFKKGNLELPEGMTLDGIKDDVYNALIDYIVETLNRHDPNQAKMFFSRNDILEAFIPGYAPKKNITLSARGHLLERLVHVKAGETRKDIADSKGDVEAGETREDIADSKGDVEAGETRKGIADLNGDVKAQDEMVEEITKDIFFNDLFRSNNSFPAFSKKDAAAIEKYCKEMVAAVIKKLCETEGNYQKRMNCVMELVSIAKTFGGKLKKMFNSEESKSSGELAVKNKSYYDAHKDINEDDIKNDVFNAGRMMFFRVLEEVNKKLHTMTLLNTGSLPSQEKGHTLEDLKTPINQHILHQVKFLLADPDDIKTVDQLKMTGEDIVWNDEVENKPEKKTENKPGIEPEKKTEEKNENKPGIEPENKTEEKNENKPENKTEEKNENIIDINTNTTENKDKVKITDIKLQANEEEINTSDKKVQKLPEGPFKLSDETLGTTIRQTGGNLCWLFSTVNSLRTTVEGIDHLNGLLKSKNNGYVVTFYGKNGKPTEYDLTDTELINSYRAELKTIADQSDPRYEITNLDHLTPLEVCALYHGCKVVDTDWKPGKLGEMNTVRTMLNLVTVPYTDEEEDIFHGGDVAMVAKVIEKHLNGGDVVTFNETDSHFITVTGIRKEGADYILTMRDSSSSKETENLKELLTAWDVYLKGVSSDNWNKGKKASAFYFAQTPMAYEKRVAKANEVIKSITADEFENAINKELDKYENDYAIRKKGPLNNESELNRCESMLDDLQRAQLIKNTQFNVEDAKAFFVKDESKGKTGLDDEILSWITNNVDISDKSALAAKVAQYAIMKNYNDKHTTHEEFYTTKLTPKEQEELKSVVGQKVIDDLFEKKKSLAAQGGNPVNGSNVKNENKNVIKEEEIKLDVKKEIKINDKPNVKTENKILNENKIVNTEEEIKLNNTPNLSYYQEKGLSFEGWHDGRYASLSDKFATSLMEDDGLSKVQSESVAKVRYGFIPQMLKDFNYSVKSSVNYRVLKYANGSPVVVLFSFTAIRKKPGGGASCARVNLEVQIPSSEKDSIYLQNLETLGTYELLPSGHSEKQDEALNKPDLEKIAFAINPKKTAKKLFSKAGCSVETKEYDGNDRFLQVTLTDKKTKEKYDVLLNPDGEFINKMDYEDCVKLRPNQVSYFDHVSAKDMKSVLLMLQWIDKSKESCADKGIEFDEDDRGIDRITTAMIIDALSDARKLQNGEKKNKDGYISFKNWCKALKINEETVYNCFEDDIDLEYYFGSNAHKEELPGEALVLALLGRARYDFGFRRKFSYAGNPRAVIYYSFVRKFPSGSPSYSSILRNAKARFKPFLGIYQNNPPRSRHPAEAYLYDNPYQYLLFLSDYKDAITFHKKPFMNGLKRDSEEQACKDVAEKLKEAGCDLMQINRISSMLKEDEDVFWQILMDFGYSKVSDLKINIENADNGAVRVSYSFIGTKEEDWGGPKRTRIKLDVIIPPSKDDPDCMATCVGLSSEDIKG